MRSLLLSAVLLVTAFAAQAQQSYGIAYQAVARDADGDALENATLDVRFTLTDAADAAVWTETHNGVMTDGFGLINLTIGSVEGAEGLASVDWAAGGFAFQVEVNSGDGFETFGSMAVTSVPVALYATSAPEPKADSLAVVTAQEAADRASADSGLQGQIDSNDTDIAANAATGSTNAAAISSNAGAISDEAAARATADSGLQGQIDSNDTDIAANAATGSTNAAAISDEAAARATADSGLQGQIDGNDTDIATNASGISANAGAISDEAAARATADSGLQGQIDGNDTDIATNASGISTNASGISSNASGISGNAADIATNASGISANAGAISDEAAARASADSGLQGQIDSNDTDIAANASGISTNVGAISDEAAARAAADGTLQDNIDAEATARFNNDSFLSGMISANGVADAALDARVTALENESSTAALDAIDSLDTAHSAEILANTTALSSETSARIAADGDLQGQIDGNDTDIAANAGAISTNATAISGNASAISSNDSDIATNATNISNNYGAMSTNATAISGNATDIATNASGISTNASGISGNATDISTNASGITTNATVISNESTARAAADSDLQDQIDNLPSSVPSISAIVEDMLDPTQEGAGLAADGSYFTNTATNYIGTATSLVSADELLDAAIKAVQDDVDQNESDSDAGDNTLQTNINALQADVDANELASDNAESALSTRLDALELDPTTATAVAAVQTDVNQNESDADAAIAAVQADVDANELASDNAESALSTRLDALELDPTTATAVTTVQNDVNQNEADSDQADADLQSELDGTQAGAGLGTDGAYTANAAAYYIAAATSLVGAVEALDVQAKANADEIAATDYFDQTDVTLHAGAGGTWTGIETANGSFTTGVSTGTMDASGNATVGGTLGVTGAATLSSTLAVTGNAELDGTLGVDGNVRIGANGATKFSIDATTGSVTTAGDLIALTGGVAAGSMTVTGTSNLQSVSASSLSVSGLLTVPSPSLGSAAANKSYVDGAISTAMTTPQAYSYLSSGTYTGLGADLGAAAVTVTVTGANLAAGTYKLHLDGNEATLTVTVNSATEIEFDITDADVSAMTSRTGLLAAQLSIDGEATGLTLFLNL